MDDALQDLRILKWQLGRRKRKTGILGRMLSRRPSLTPDKMRKKIVIVARRIHNFTKVNILECKMKTW
jgi:hypothetical protein